MAQFRATIQGQRGQASRLGSKNSGITANVNGWHSGVKVHANTDDDGNDFFTIHATGGSGSNGFTGRYPGTVKMVNGQPEFIPSDYTAAKVPA